jgi:protein Tex
VEKISSRIAQELGVREPRVVAAIELLDGGATVPFIARYRKEATDSLDDTQLRSLDERLGYLRELDDRRAVILKSIDEQGKSTPELTEAIDAADSKARLEDLYLPYRPKRRTKAQIAREAGLEPLAEALLGNPTQEPDEVAVSYVDAEKGVDDVKAALEGARHILTERFAEDAELIGALREYFWGNAWMVSKVVDGKQEAGAKFADYFDYAEALRKIPSHRALALFRGRNEDVLGISATLDGSGDDPAADAPCVERVARRFGISDEDRPGDRWLLDTARWAWRVKMSLHIELEVMARLREAAEDESIRVFAGNLRDLLLAAPAGRRPTIGLDPGFRTGVKVAVMDGTGKLLETAAIHPHQPQRRWDEAIAVLAALAHRHGTELVAIGNGTASRETDKLVAELIQRHPELKLTKVMVSESGASVYSASAYAAEEFPDHDVTLRGAASIGRRLQDPLAELVKIDPKSIGVGQYQHDVGEVKLSRALDAVVEDCVNAVGVDLNTASAPLLARVSGIGDSVARNIVSHRDANGAFMRRKALMEVPRLGAKAFEQAAGFLRIMGGDDPLDASGVHPESYPVVRRMVAATGRRAVELIGDRETLRGLSPSDFTDGVFGLPTVTDILRELEKPGRDPRPEFKTAIFRDGVEKLSDLEAGMVLEGVVTNVANFGAFVDVGVHQDGLVHVSAMAERFVKDPRDVVRPGDVVKVKVLDVDVKRKRIALSMRLRDPTEGKSPSGGRPGGGKPGGKAKVKPVKSPDRAGGGDGALADAFARARKK